MYFYNMILIKNINICSRYHIYIIRYIIILK
nr:MAG TPA: hypothetical protein [Bacteriophage sp.]DAS26392.1 MAG TPA: hypothetical protein [Caudoviricetes sp.]